MLDDNHALLNFLTNRLIPGNVFRVGYTALCNDLEKGLNLDVFGVESESGSSEIIPGRVAGLFDLGLRLQRSLNRPDRRGCHLLSGPVLSHLLLLRVGKNDCLVFFAFVTAGCNKHPGFKGSNKTR